MYHVSIDGHPIHFDATGWPSALDPYALSRADVYGMDVDADTDRATRQAMDNQDTRTDGQPSIVILNGRTIRVKRLDPPDDANAAIDAERETHPLIFNETTLPP